MRKAKQLIIDYQRTFGTPEGQNVLADLAAKAPLFRGSICLSKEIDVNALLVMEGERRVLVHIYAMLGKDPYAEQPSHALNEGE